MTESENDATQRKYVHAVAITLQSRCLIKLSHGLLLGNFNLAFEVVSNSIFVEIVEVTEPAEYMLYKVYTVAIAHLHHAG